MSYSNIFHEYVYTISGVNGHAQAQALVQSSFESDIFGDLFKGPFNSCVGHVCGLVLRSNLKEESKGPSGRSLESNQRRFKEAEVHQASIRSVGLVDSVDRINEKASILEV